MPSASPSRAFRMVMTASIIRQCYGRLAWRRKTSFALSPQLFGHCAGIAVRRSGDGVIAADSGVFRSGIRELVKAARRSHGTRGASLPGLLRSFRLDRPNRPHVRPLSPISSLDEERERNGLAIKESHPPDLRRRNTKNGDRQDRDEAGEQRRRSLHRESPGGPEGFHHEDGETGGADQAKIEPNHKQKTSWRPFGQIAEAQASMHEVETMPGNQTRPLRDDELTPNQHRR